MTDGRVPGVSPPSRRNRNDRRQRARRVEAVVTVAVVVLAGLYAWTRSGDPTTRPLASGSTAPPAGSGRTPELAVLSISGGAGPMILVVGKVGGPVAISFPQRLTQIVPGMGETTLEALGQLDGETVRVGVSNTLGLWVRHFGVVSVASMSKAAGAAGGLPVDLGRAFVWKGTSIGPGKVTLTGPQVAAFLAGPKTEAAARWGELSSALLTDHVALPPSAFVETDDAAAVSRLLAAARGAEATAVPVTDVGGLVQTPDLPAIDALAVRRLGTAGPPIPVIVENGNGVPGIGAKVAARLIPAGFRVVLSTNAVTFSSQHTSVTALGKDMAGAARRARTALGVGRVSVSSVPSGVADVKIVVGKDFK